MVITKTLQGKKITRILHVLLRNPVQCTCLKYGWAVMYAYKMVCIYIRCFSFLFASGVVALYNVSTP
jgi:hypothetical protein